MRIIVALASGVGCMFLPLPWSILVWGGICLALMVTSDPDFVPDCRMIWRHVRGRA